MHQFLFMVNIGRRRNECKCVCARAEDAMEQRDWAMAHAGDEGSAMDEENDTADDLADIDVSCIDIGCI